MNNSLLNKKQLSSYLGMSIGKIDNLMKDDKIDYYKIGKNVRFNLDEIKEWIMKYRTTNYSKIIDLKTDNFKTDKVYDEGQVMY